ncbi:MAG: hypothetical protein JST60_20365 [Chloroflexi bacterium SZAS-1]|jgi:hypothetical protein|nr:hypothetical protein [Chloroflexi bacterium SZAS-1]HNP87941.1 hypothetical protein [Kouleothrix sp.]
MNTIIFPLFLIILALLLAAFGPSRAGALGSILLRSLRAAFAWLRRDSGAQQRRP